MSYQDMMFKIDIKKFLYYKLKHVSKFLHLILLSQFVWALKQI